MKIVDQVTSQGGERPNEDRLGSSGDLAWVIDGATDLEDDTFLAAGSDVHWLVDRVSQCLAETGALGASEGPENLLRSLSIQIREELASWGFPAGRIHPTCSIGLLLARADSLQMARVGDPVCLSFGAKAVELSTEFFGRREAVAVERAGNGGLNQDAVRRGIRERRQEYIEGSLEESVFSGHRNAHLRIDSATVNSTLTDYVLLCTDGFARAVVDYGLYADWAGLVRDALESGLSAVVDRMRTYEDEQASGATGRPLHFKKSDDATALLVRV